MRPAMRARASATPSLRITAASAIVLVMPTRATSRRSRRVPIENVRQSIPRSASSPSSAALNAATPCTGGGRFETIQISPTYEVLDHPRDRSRPTIAVGLLTQRRVNTCYRRPHESRDAVEHPAHAATTCDDRGSESRDGTTVAALHRSVRYCLRADRFAYPFLVGAWTEARDRHRRERHLARGAVPT